MTIDLKWGIPLAMPFVFLGVIRLLWWAAGAEWSNPELAASFAMLFGLATGFMAVAHMTDKGIYWHVRLGRDGDA